MALGFEHPFRCTIAGPSQSGKTEFAKKLIKAMPLYITPCPRKIYWAYGIANEEQFDSIRQCVPEGIEIEFVDGVPTLSMFDKREPSILFADDLQSSAGSSKEMADLFTKGCHHLNLSAVLMLQNLFHQGKSMRDIHTSTNYLVLFKNPRDVTQLTHLQRQCFPHSNNFLLDAYKKATEQPYGYLLIDFQQATPNKYRVCSQIFPPGDIIIYEPYKK